MFMKMKNKKIMVNSGPSGTNLIFMGVEWDIPEYWSRTCKKLSIRILLTSQDCFGTKGMKDKFVSKKGFRRTKF